MKNIAAKFGKHLRSKRKSLGISQEKLALLAEIDRSYVGRIERGEVSVTIERVYELAAALDCSVKDILP